MMKTLSMLTLLFIVGALFAARPLSLLLAALAILSGALALTLVLRRAALREYCRGWSGRV